jgi:hypothetical protein
MSVSLISAKSVATITLEWHGKLRLHIYWLRTMDPINDNMQVVGSKSNLQISDVCNLKRHIDT